MAQVLSGGKVKLDDGSIVTAQNLGWYDGYQYYNGSLAPQRGVIHPNSPQQGAGQAVSPDVNKQSAAAQGKSYEEFSNYLKQSSPGYTPQQISNAAGTSLPGGSGAGYSTQPTINLPELYDQLYKSSGISDLEAQLSQRDKEFIEATGTINDNPFLSEATRVGRVAKLDELYQKRTANLRNDIATKKADIETRLNLETKQFDIESQAARDALNQFNTLLSLGALDGASGEDIANITRSTGLSSQAIQSAINAQRQKNRQTAVQTFTRDDGTVTAVVLDTQTGEVISQTSLGSIGNAQGSGGGGAYKEADYKQFLREDAQAGLTLSQIFSLYTGYLNPDEILTLYNANSIYGPDKGDRSNLAKYGVSQE